MSESMFDYEADVLVVGSGAAGLAAAVTAAREGCSVVLFEREEHLGGTTGLSGGTAWIPNNTSMRGLGIEDPRDDALRYLARTAFPQYYAADHETLGLPVENYEMLATFYDVGSVAIDYLTEAGALDVHAEVGPSDLMGIEFPDYSAHLDEDTVIEGRHVGPGFTSGVTMVDQLSSGAARLGVEVKTGHTVQVVLRVETDGVLGLEVRAGHRALVARAERAIVFGSGGYAHNAEYVRRYLPGRVYGSCATPGAVGDFLRIGQQLGAKLGNMHHAWWKQVPVEVALRSPGPPSVFLPYGDAMIQVNKYGHRVVNEKAPYNERGQIHAQYDIAGREYPNQLLFMIWDDTVAQAPDPWPFRPPVPQPGEKVDYVVSADGWSSLAEQIDARLAAIAVETGGVRLSPDFLDNLHATVERFNGFARTGVDEDFRRGESPIEQAWNAPRRPGSPNATMAPISPEGPYHCVILGAGTLDTNGGPVTDSAARVLDATGTPIPGLFGAGNCVASPAGQAYWGPGATIGLALTFGHIAGREAASAPVQEPTLG